MALFLYVSASISSSFLAVSSLSQHIFLCFIVTFGTCLARLSAPFILVRLSSVLIIVFHLNIDFDLFLLIMLD